MLLLLALAAIVPAARAAETSAERPNFIVLLTDDQAFRAIGYNNPRVKTPNLDRLAGEGMIFDRAYIATPICAASRASLLSGVFPQQHGVIALKGPAFADWVAREDRRTLPQVLREAGYRSALFGKSHLGSPQLQGFDTGQQFREPDDTKTFPAAEQFLAEAAQGDRPFFLWLGIRQPHLPLDPPEKYLAMYRDVDVEVPANFRPRPEPRSINNQGLPGEHFYREQGRRNPKTGGRSGPPRNEDQLRHFIRIYYAVVSHLDAQIGRLVAQLDRLGLRENTVIVFLSDNGYHLGSHGLGNKITMHEESVRVPMFITGPPLNEQRGTRCDALVSSLDVFPTLVELAGLTPPDYLMGQSLVPLLEDPSATLRPFVGSECVGVGGGPGQGHRMVRTPEWKYVLTGTNEEHLFHAPSDQAELTNLANSAEHRERLQQMRGYMRQWIERVGDTHQPPP